MRLLFLFLFTVSTEAFDIRKINDAKTFSKAAYEINDTNLVDEEVATNIFHNVVNLKKVGKIKKIVCSNICAKNLEFLWDEKTLRLIGVFF